MVNRLMLRLMVRELFKNWFQYLSMFAITALASTLFLGFISNTLTLRRRAEKYLSESNLADLIAQGTSFGDEDREFFSSLSSRELEYRIYSDGEFSFQTENGAEHNTAKIFVFDGQINRPYLVEGEKGFLIDKTVADLHGYRIGDRMKVEFTGLRQALKAAEEQINRYVTLLRPLYPDLKDVEIPSAYEFQVTGLMYSVEGVNIYSNSPVFLTEEIFLSTLKEEICSQLPLSDESFPANEELIGQIAESMVRGFSNQALLKTENYLSVKEQIKEKFAQKEENNLLFVYDRDTMESVVILDNEAEQSKNMLYIFPVIFFLVSVLVIMTSIGRLILRERINIGTFKALGIPSGRIIFHYAFMSAVVNFFGCAAGAVLGPLIVPAVMTVKYGLIFSMPELLPTQFSLLWTAGLTFVVCLLSILIGFWSARSVIKENPAECMRPKQIRYTPKSKSEKKRRTNPVLLSCRMAIRNIRINAGRSLMTVIGVMGCSALLVTSFGIGDTMKNSVENDYGRLCRYDVNSPYSAEREEEFFEELTKLQSEGKIEKYERVKIYVATAQTQKQNKDISVYVIEENSAMSSITQGGNTMSKITAETLGVKEGDTFSFALGSCVVEYTIEDVVPTSTWNGFFTTENLFSEECYYQENVWVKTADPEAVRDDLNAVNGTNTAKTMADRRGEIESLISSTNSMKYTLMVFAILLSLVVLYNLSLLNVKERTRDMATLKVLGFGNFQVSVSLIVEILLLTVIGTVCGGFFGYPLMVLVMKLNEMATMAFVYAIRPVSYFLSLFGSLLTAAAINAVFGLLIGKIDMSESLKSVE